MAQPKSITKNIIFFPYTDSNKQDVLNRIKTMLKLTDNGTPDFNAILPIPEDLMIRDDDSLLDATNWWKDCTAAYLKSLDMNMFKDNIDLINVFRIPPEFIEDYIQSHPLDDEQLEMGLSAWLNILNYGCPTWWTWAYNQWGTPMNADAGKLKDMPKKNKFKLEFLTRHTLPTSLIVRLCPPKDSDVEPLYDKPFPSFNWYFYSPLTKDGGIISWDENKSDIKTVTYKNDPEFAAKMGFSE